MNTLKTYYTGKDRVQAVQWNANGDHPSDDSQFVDLGTHTDGEPDVVLSEGKLVRRFRNPQVPDRAVCQDCGYAMHEHGWIDSGEDGVIVCPGDYVVTNSEGDTYATKPREFETLFQLVSL